MEVRTTAGGPAVGGMAPVYAAAEAGLGELDSLLEALDSRQKKADAKIAEAWSIL